MSLTTRIVPKVLREALGIETDRVDTRKKGDLYVVMPRWGEGQRRRAIRRGLKAWAADPKHAALRSVSQCRWKRLIRLHGPAEAHRIVLEGGSHVPAPTA
jgi:bifunctional DNA-binding transcriptional regulator/antitoxin component of YhaV-PrlF toxin-antitoxin module